MEWTRTLSRLSKGVIFAVLVLALSSGSTAQTNFTVLHNFTGRDGDGGGLWGSLVLDSQGNVYGTTSGGGAYRYGTVFDLTPDGNGSWTETVLHSFDYPSEAGAPTSSLVFDTAGNLYGTAPIGGDHQAGDVFELSPASGGWKESIIYDFGDSSNDGFKPYAGMVIDGAGNLYGTTPEGGVNGDVFELSPGLGGWTESILHNFCTGCNDGGAPYAGVILDPAGDLYGITEGGGTYAAGTVYEVKHTQSGWTERVLHDFGSNARDGVGPRVGALTMDSSGNIYGTTSSGGTHVCLGGGGCGTIFKLSLGPKGHW